MAAPLVRSAHPGIYRRGERYVVVYRVNGRQRRETVRTLDQARRLKRAREADRDRGEFQARSAVHLRAFLEEWVDRYHGNGRRGFREGTRAEYRRLLDAFAYRYFDDRLKLSDVTPHHLARFVGWLADERQQGLRVAKERRRQEAQRKEVALSTIPMPAVKPVRLADATIRNAVIPVRAALTTAVQEGLIRHNPGVNLALPVRQRIEEDDEQDVRALSRAQLEAFLRIVNPEYRLLFELLASTGLRVSEAAGLQRRHLRLEGSAPCVRVRRAIVRGQVEPPKTRYGRRDVPLPPALVSKLRRHVAATPGGDEAPAFPSRAGTPLDPDNVRRRILKPVAEEVDAARAAFHAFRHTYASMQLAAGVNILQLSRALGHHSASFTLERYCHLLEGDAAPPLDLAGELALGDNASDNTTTPNYPPLDVGSISGESALSPLGER